MIIRRLYQILKLQKRDSEATNLDSLKAKIENSKFIPSGISILRAGIAAIPFVGGALDHLIFHKAGEIKVKNIEISIEQINTKVKSLSKEMLAKEWFESTEALDMFYQLIEKVQFEADKQKIQTLSNIYAVSGTHDFVKDPNKFAVLRKVAELTTVQKEILLIISKVPHQQKQFTSGSLNSKGTAIWFEDILNAVRTNPKGNFWEGTLHLDIEVGILESLNLIRRSNVLLATDAGYELTSLGKLLIQFLKT